jgi:hypothetical protein
MSIASGCCRLIIDLGTECIEVFLSVQQGRRQGELGHAACHVSDISEGYSGGGK